MMNQSDFLKGGMASVWVGNFASDIDLDDYLNLSRQFETDFGFELNDRDMPEMVVKDTQTLIADLVAGFSWSKLYAAEIVNSASAQGIKNATTMVVFLNFEYRPQQAKPKKNTPLIFLAAVRFSN